MKVYKKIINNKKTEPDLSGMHVFLFAHQDDEFGVFPQFKFLLCREKSAIVRCIYLTNGAGGKASINVRNSEAMKVLRSYGIPESEVIFLGTELDIADGHLYQHLEKAMQAVEMLLKDCKIASLYVPAYEGGHQDHDSVNAIGTALGLFRPNTEVRQFPLYHGKGLPGSWFKLIDPIAENGKPQNTKFSVLYVPRFCFSCLQYRSQWRTWIGLWPFFIYVMLIRRKQVLQNVNERVFFERPHAGPLLYERRFGVNYKIIAGAFTTFHAYVLQEIVSPALG